MGKKLRKVDCLPVRGYTISTVQTADCTDNVIHEADQREVLRWCATGVQREWTRDDTVRNG